VWTVAVVALGLALLGVVEALPGGLGTAAFVAAALLLVLTTVTVGAMLVTRLPRHIVGWLLLAGGLSVAFAVGTGALADYGLNVHPGSVPGAVWLAVLSNATFGAFIGLLGGYVPLYFPTGHLPSPRWWPVPVLAAVPTFVVPLANLLVPLPPGTYPAGVINPLAVSGAGGQLLALLTAVSTPIGIVALVGVIASLVVRYRRAHGIERQQLKWFAYVGVVVILAFLVAFTAGGFTTGPLAIVGTVAWIVALLGLALMPVAIGIAILRYRLFEIDLLINRTAVYGLVTALLVVVFGAANILLQRLVESVTGQHSDLVAAALGVGAAVTFTPLRRRVRPLVDRVLPERAVLTLLFTDIVGSTQTVVELGDARWRGLLDRYLSTVRGELSRYRGHEVNTAGDASFATFERPADGLACAWAIRSAVRALGLQLVSRFANR
jgi:hypothetical protein